MKQKRIMIIGAKWEQVPLIQSAKSKGCFVLATDPDAKAEGLALADAVEILDPRDLYRALEVARQYDIDGITADQCDYSHYAAVFVSTWLGLPNDNLTAAQMTTNKRWMRERCRDHQIFQPRFIACRTLDDVHAAADLIGFPVIVKPVDNRGSFGVHRVDNKEMLPQVYLDALMNAHSREVLVEAYIEGIHITVDGCMDQKGKHHNLAIASKKVMPGEKPIITEVFYPARLSPEMTEHVLKTNSKVVDALGIVSGLTHSEYIVDAKERCFLVETANRGGGVLTSGKIVPAMSGVNVSELLIANALKEPYDVIPRQEPKTVMLKFFVFSPGRIKSIEGTEKAEKLPGVLHLLLTISPGQEIIRPQSGAGRHGFVIVEGKDAAEVEQLFEKVQSSIRIHYS